MSWLSDSFGSVSKGYGDYMSWLTSAGHLANNSVSDWFTNELSNKSDLRGAQAESILGGVPIVGDVLQGLEGATQLEDLYNNFGKVPEYPALGGASGQVASAASQVYKKIEDGKNDLYEYYTGSPDDFRSGQNGMYM